LAGKIAFNRLEERRKIAMRRKNDTPVPQVDGLFWTLLALTFATLAAQNVGNFPLSVHYFKTLSGGLPLLDLRFFYSPSDAYGYFDALGPLGRQAYLTEIWTIDLVVPMLLSFFLWALLKRGVFRKFRFLAFSAAGVYYLKNILITCLVLHFPGHWDSLAWTAACANLAKQMLYFGFLAWGLAGLALKP
jgi:hypothetical protein